MVAGWSLWFWIVGALIGVQGLSWWLLATSPKPAAATMGVTSFLLTFMPAVAAMGGISQWRMFKLGHELLLPVERKNLHPTIGHGRHTKPFSVVGRHERCSDALVAVDRPAAVSTRPVCRGAGVFPPHFRSGSLAWRSGWRDIVQGRPALFVMMVVVSAAWLIAVGVGRCRRHRTTASAKSCGSPASWPCSGC